MLESQYLKFIELLSRDLTVEEIKRNDPRVQEALKKIRAGGNIYIWPAAQMGEFIYHKLSSRGYKNVCLLDRASREIGLIKVQSPYDVTIGDNDVVVIASLNHSDAIYNSAVSMNCKHILMYYHLELLNEKESMAYPVDFYSDLLFGDLTQHLLDNKDSYMVMYESLEDEPSKLAFLNNMLFRLTYDITYTFEYDRHCAAYFDPAFFPQSSETVFIDGGAFNGDTLKEFLEASHNDYKSYYLFEPDHDLVMEARKVSTDRRIHYMNKGLYSKTCELRFNKTCGENGSIDENGTVTVQVVSIDEAVQEPVTYIKMDIEGAELSALEGAKQTIKKYSPNLAICVYHKASDYADIFNFIRNVNPDYKFYLRHHLNYYADSVLYAIKA